MSVISMIGLAGRKIKSMMIDKVNSFFIISRFEAQEQMERDKMVEEQICLLLKYRAIDCANRERYMAVDQLDPTTRCGELLVSFQF